MVGQTPGCTNQGEPFAGYIRLDIPFCGTPRASQMLKQLNYVGALAFQGPQSTKLKQTQRRFLFKSSQLNHLWYT